MNEQICLNEITVTVPGWQKIIENEIEKETGDFNPSAITANTPCLITWKERIINTVYNPLDGIQQGNMENEILYNFLMTKTVDHRIAKKQLNLQENTFEQFVRFVIYFMITIDIIVIITSN